MPMAQRGIPKKDKNIDTPGKGDIQADSQTPTANAADEKKKLSQDQINRKVDKEVKKFMKAARDFLATKGGGEVPPEWELSLTLLEGYYRQYMEINYHISNLDSLIFNGRYGPMPSPLLSVRDKASVRLEAIMKEMGLSMKSAIKMNVVEPKKEESVLDKYMKGQVERR